MKLLTPVVAWMLLFFLAGCQDENTSPDNLVNWKKLGLDGKTINQLQVDGTRLYAATTSGLYAYETSANNADFTLAGFANKNVQAVEILSSGEVMASLFDKSGTETPELYLSSNDGVSWQAVEGFFGGDVAEPVIDLHQHPTQPNTLLASGFGVVAKSVDKGKTWSVLYGDWGMLATGVSVVTVNPNEPTQLWAGGQGGIENGFLLHSDNETDWDIWSDLVSNPTVVKEITFVPENPDQLFVGFEGALLKTTNGGATWRTLISSEQHKFFFGVGVSTANKSRVYTGGWLKTADPQPLILQVSNDGGDTWQDFEFKGERFGGIWEMLLTRKDNKDCLYLGLDKGGVYQVTVNN